MREKIFPPDAEQSLTDFLAKCAPPPPKYSQISLCRSDICDVFDQQCSFITRSQHPAISPGKIWMLARQYSSDARSELENTILVRIISAHQMLDGLIEYQHEFDATLHHEESAQPIYTYLLSNPGGTMLALVSYESPACQIISLSEESKSPQQVMALDVQHGIRSIHWLTDSQLCILPDDTDTRLEVHTLIGRSVWKLEISLDFSITQLLDQPMVSASSLTEQIQCLVLADKHSLVKISLSRQKNPDDLLPSGANSPSLYFVSTLCPQIPSHKSLSLDPTELIADSTTEVAYAVETHFIGQFPDHESTLYTQCVVIQLSPIFLCGCLTNEGELKVFAAEPLPSSSSDPISSSVLDLSVIDTVKLFPSNPETRTFFVHSYCSCPVPSVWVVRHSELVLVEFPWLLQIKRPFSVSRDHLFQLVPTSTQRVYTCDNAATLLTGVCVVSTLRQSRIGFISTTSIDETDATASGLHQQTLLSIDLSQVLSSEADVERYEELVIQTFASPSHTSEDVTLYLERLSQLFRTLGPSDLFLKDYGHQEGWLFPSARSNQSSDEQVIEQLDLAHEKLQQLSSFLAQMQTVQHEFNASLSVESDVVQTCVRWNAIETHFTTLQNRITSSLEANEKLKREATILIPRLWTYLVTLRLRTLYDRHLPSLYQCVASFAPHLKESILWEPLLLRHILGSRVISSVIIADPLRPL